MKHRTDRVEPSLRRGVLLVLLAASAAYANSIGNGFAYDDPVIIEQHPSVISGDVVGALTSSYWPDARGGAGLYRPLTTASFAVEWRVWGGRPSGFHATNVVLHMLVSALCLLLLRSFMSTGAAIGGALLFAVHPVHTEAVANVVGRGELLAAAFVLLACLVYLWRASAPLGRGLRIAAVVALYGLGLASKEMAVTLPGLLIVLAWARDGFAEGSRAAVREWHLFALFTGALVTYLVVRASVLGTVTGELPAPYLSDLDTVGRWWTAISVWPQYVRLMLFPLDLVVDYGPAVLIPTRSFDADVLFGLGLGAGAIWLAVRSWHVARMVSIGLMWFALAVLPVSNLLFPTGILLAERTLYIPSIGLSFVLAGALAWLLERHPTLTGKVLTLSLVAGVLLMVRTTTRNPAWMSTYAMLDELSRSHPESFLSLRARASGLAGAGEIEEAARYYELVLEMAPTAYSVLVEVGRFYGRQENWNRASEILDTAIRTFPAGPAAWQVRAEHLLLQGRGRDAHRLALEGLRRVGSDRELWMLVSESYIAKGDFEAAGRARIAALGAEPETAQNWYRLADILELQGRDEEAASARARAELLELAEEAGERTEPPHPLGVSGA